MAKKKTKQMPMDTTCEQQDNGSWQWKTEGFTWAWTDAVGVNTGIVTKNDKFVGKLYCKTLNDAVMYSWGFVQGFNEGTKMGD